MAIIKGKKPHVLAVPFPAQGHVKPLMKLALKIAKRGIKVTFVNIEPIHEKLLASSKLSNEKEDNLVLASIPDGRGPDDDPNDIFNLLDSLRDALPGFLTDMIERINSLNDDERISCVIFDITIGYIFDTVEKMGAEPVVFQPPSSTAMAIVRHIPKLMEEGSLDSNGSLAKGDNIILSENIPPWKNNELWWSVPVDLTTQKIFFDCSINVVNTVLNKSKWLVGNTCYELEPAACDLNPNWLPIGPLLEANIPNSSSSFLLEDDSCISWLSTKPPGSVIYVSFGSLAVLSQVQLDELALGLEQSGRVFLWVVRSDLANGSRVVYPDGYLERVDIGGFGKIVEWAPQEDVLSHPSVACFISHCGWNSTLSGVPFLCWPYFSDQFHNQNYICDQWEIGLRTEPDENGIRSRNEIKTKIEMLLCDDKFKGNAMKLKEMAKKSFL